MYYREMNANEADRIEQINATVYIENAWRRKNTSSEYVLTRIDWTEHELPNGLAWHKNRFIETIKGGGVVIGCFEGDRLIGYAAVNRRIFGTTQKYALLDQLFVSLESRNKGIGKTLVQLCAKKARDFGAEKLYICAGSSQDTIAFYNRLGCKCAVEPDEALYKEDPNDIQLELPI